MKNIKRTIEDGKLADLVVLSQDTLSGQENEILDTKVIYTIVSGKINYKLIK